MPVTLIELVGPNGKSVGLDHFGYSAPYKVLDEKFGFSFATVMEVSEVASWNAPSPIDVTLAGMVMEVSEVALLNALSPIDVSVLPAAKVTEVSAVA